MGSEGENFLARLKLPAYHFTQTPETYRDRCLARLLAEFCNPKKVVTNIMKINRLQG